MIYRWIGLFLLFTCLFFCSKKNATNPKAVSTEDLLTRDNEMSGWTRAGEHWNASSSGDLTNYINGEAVVYTNRGFVEASKQEYQGTVLGNTESVEVRIFDQGSSANAKSVFDELVRQMSNPLDWSDKVGKEARIERFSLSQRILFYKEKYFISLIITSGSDEALDVLKTFAINVDGKIE